MTPEQRAKRRAELDAADAAGASGTQPSAAQPTMAPSSAGQPSAAASSHKDRRDALDIADAVEARRNAGGGFSGRMSDVNDSARLFANGVVPFSGVDRFSALVNTGIGNIGSSIKVFGEPLMDDPTYEDERDKQFLESRKAAARVNEGVHPLASSALYGAGLVSGPGKFLKATGLARPLLTLGGAAAGAAFQGMGGDALQAYGGYSMMDKLTKLMSRK